MADLSYSHQLDEDKQRVEEFVDYFDLLPDPIVAAILNKVFDAKSLCNCLAVSKRFATLVGDVDSVCVKVNSSKRKQPSEDLSKMRNGSKSFFKNFVSKFVMKPLNFIQQVVLSNKKGNSSYGYVNGVDILNWVGNVLKNFDDVKSIKVEIPCYGGGEIEFNKKNVPLLRWEAEYGKEMENCVILGATSVVQKKNFGKKKLGSSIDQGSDDSNNSSNNDDHEVFSDEELRLRIIWIISCLIASAGRHNLMKKLVNQCRKLSDAVISDVGKQGKVHMNAEQIIALRDSIDSTTHTNGDSETMLAPSGPVARPAVAAGPEAAQGPLTPRVAYVGNLVMKLWYVKELELPSSGKVMKGATLVVIKPEVKVNGGGRCAEEKGKEILSGNFEGDEVFEEAARELLKRKVKRVYRLEMNTL